MAQDIKIKPRYIHFLLIQLLLLAVFSMAVDACAEPRHGRRGYDRDFSHRGRVIYRQHHGRKPAYRPVWVGKREYHHHRGRFYRRAHRGFIAVGAPIGAFVVSLPIGHTRLVFGRQTYYHCDRVYYRRVPSGYRVVEAPPKVVIVRETPSAGAASDRVGDLVAVTEGLLNVRSGPGQGFDVIHQVRKDDILEVFGEAPDWLYVRLPNGEFGWVLTVHTITTHHGANG